MIITSVQYENEKSSEISTNKNSKNGSIGSVDSDSGTII